jgi:hypothetical protein
LAVAENAAVRIENVVVTGVRGSGDGDFFVQVAEADYDPSYGSRFSGIYCNRSLGSSPVLAVGDLVNVEGPYEEAFGLSWISGTSATFVGVGSVPAPTIVNPVDIATGGTFSEDYESVLVRVENVTPFDPNPDAPSDHGEFAVTGVLRVDDLLYPDAEVVGRAASSFNYIQGPLYFSFANTKIVPRGLADIQAL